VSETVERERGLNPTLSLAGVVVVSLLGWMVLLAIAWGIYQLVA